MNQVMDLLRAARSAPGRVPWFVRQIPRMLEEARLGAEAQADLLTDAIYDAYSEHGVDADPLVILDQTRYNLASAIYEHRRDRKVIPFASQAEIREISAEAARHEQARHATTTANDIPFRAGRKHVPEQVSGLRPGPGANPRYASVWGAHDMTQPFVISSGRHTPLDFVGQPYMGWDDLDGFSNVEFIDYILAGRYHGATGDA